MADCPLTHRQLEALRAYAETGDYARAARRLRIAPNTVRHHLAQVRARLKVDTTVAAVWQMRDELEGVTR